MPSLRSATVAKLCAVVLGGRKGTGRFAMDTEEVSKALQVSPDVFSLMLKAAIASDWVRLKVGSIELKAAGIHIAKSYLKLPS